MQRQGLRFPRTRARSLLRLALLGLTLAGCVRHKLEIVEGDGAFGVGADWLGENVGVVRAAVVQLGLSCHKQSHGGKIDIPIECNGGGAVPAQLSEAHVDDPTVFQVVGWERDTVRVRPLRVGRTQLHVTANTSDGEQTADGAIEARVPDGLQIAGECLEDRAPSPLAFPVSSMARLSVQVMGGGDPLQTTTLPPIDWGPIVPMDAPAPVPAVGTFAMPAARASVHVKSAALPTFDQELVAYDTADIDGVALRPSSPGPVEIFSLKNPLRVDISPLVHGQPACQERSAAWPRTVRIETPDICYLGRECADPKQCVEQKVEGALTSAVWLRGYHPGTCRVTATSDVTGHTAALSLSFFRDK